MISLPFQERPTVRLGQPTDERVIEDRHGGRMVMPADAVPRDGASFRFDWYLAPRTPASPLHAHRLQTERLEVVSGQLTVVLDGVELILGPGDGVTISPGQLHTGSNGADVEAHVCGEFSPALDIRAFFERLLAIDRSPGRLSKVIRWSVLFTTYPEYFEFPLPLRIAMRLLALVTRGLEHRLPATTE